MARTNIELDSNLIEAVMQRYGFATKREAVHVALQRLALQPMTRAEAQNMRGFGWAGDLDAMRSDRTVDTPELS